eukprot:TRINITY_DN7265_c0_g1_i3.p2 TRINITY_DN7265_c0_g1~~TRINITY_DN7265_c0_g1_i3.p2  ORF type:complete len:117 (-),score=12.86 TRINITY_DN7265_c0_g1_i3:59-409(-)
MFKSLKGCLWTLEAGVVGHLGFEELRLECGLRSPEALEKVTGMTECPVSVEVTGGAERNGECHRPQKLGMAWRRREGRVVEKLTWEFTRRRIGFERRLTVAGVREVDKPLPPRRTG